MQVNGFLNVSTKDTSRILNSNNLSLA